jgi:hypothetical protein
LAAAVLVGSSSALIWRWTAPSTPLASPALPVDGNAAASRALASNQPSTTAAPSNTRTSPAAAPASAASNAPAAVRHAEAIAGEAAKATEEATARARRSRVRSTTAGVKLEKRTSSPRHTGATEASSADQDRDLDQLFQPGGPGERAASGTDGDSELRAALPGGIAKSNTANGAPLPD